MFLSSIGSKGVIMKKLLVSLTVVFSAQVLASDITLICNDQNSHSVYSLEIAKDLSTAELLPLLADSGVLSQGSNNLKLQEGESSDSLFTYAGKTKRGLSLALLLNAKAAGTLERFETLDVEAYFQHKKDGDLSGHTSLLCSKN